MDQPTPQVLIEARFFELSSTASRHIGVDWNALGSDGISVTADPLTRSRQVTETETEITTGRLYSESRDQTQDVSTDLATGVISGTNQIVNAVTSQLPGVLQDSSETSVVETRGAILDMAQFGVVLHALKGTAGAKQLSNPKVVVNSDEQATIHIGEQTPIFRSSVDSTGDGAVRTYELDPDFGGEVIEELDLLAEENESGRGGRAGSSSGMRRYTTPKGYLDLGTKLTVAPSVKTDTDIYIRVVPELVSVTGTRALGSGESQVSYPVLFSTRVNTQFTIRSGQTIALGGLVNERTSKTERKVPVLSSLPALGRLFRYESEETSQTETIVFLTVKIVSSEKLSTTSAVPVRSFLGQSEIERIRQEDARGAEYDEETARALLEEAGDPLLSPSERILRKRESESSETPAPEAPDRETVEEADLGVESLPGTEADALSADGEAPATDAPEPQTAVPAGRETSPGEPLGQDGNTGTDTDGTETVVPAQ
jgi:type II secretory pathway component GspD/PulD (secretin)